jgi:hypothetical protein
MKETSNISATWSEEVPESCMNGVRGKLWPDYITDWQEHDIPCASNRECVTEVAKQTGQDDTEVGDISELLESHGEEVGAED